MLCLIGGLICLFLHIAATESTKCVLCLTSHSDKVIISKESTLAKGHQIFKARSVSKSK